MTDQEKREKVIKGIQDGLDFFEDRVHGSRFEAWIQAQKDALALLKAQEPITGETSDGYHTFNELYHHRAVLFSVIVANYKDRAWKSVRHHDGTMYEGMFIVGIDTPDGQATYHYDIDPYWDMFDCRVLDNAPEWDGHTPAQAIERIGKLALLKAQEPRVMTLEDVLKLRFNDVVYFEMAISSVVIPAIVIDVIEHMPNGEIGLLQLRHIQQPTNNADLEYYGKTWRVWDRMPTDEQRGKVKWDSQGLRCALSHS